MCAAFVCVATSPWVSEWRRASASIAQSAADLEQILQRLRTGHGTAGKLLTDPRLYDRLHSISVRTDSILADFQRDPGRHLDTTVEIFLGLCGWQSPSNGSDFACSSCAPKRVV